MERGKHGAEGAPGGFEEPEIVYAREFLESTKVGPESLTFDDVIILPNHTENEPGDFSPESRLTRRIDLKIPIISAAMDKVTEQEMAIAMAREGGAGVIHRNLSIKEQARQVEKVKRDQNAFIEDPRTVRPESTIGDVLAGREKFGFGMFLVTDQESNGRLLGMIPYDNYRYATPDMKVADLMLPVDMLVTLSEESTKEDAEQLFRELSLEPLAPKLKKLPVVDTSGRLRGLFTHRDVELRQQFPSANLDNEGRLVVGAAIGGNPAAMERAEALINKGVDFLVTDTAHVDRPSAIRLIRELKEVFPDTDVIAGNVVRGDAAIRLAEAGADAVKVGMGSGSICTTSIGTGVGRGQLRSVMECAAALDSFDVPVIADGGIRHPDDLAKSLAAGAESAMIGGMLAGTEESPGKVIKKGGVKVAKEYRGMGSAAAMEAGSADRYGHEDASGRLPEGVEAEVVYRGEVSEVVGDLVHGLTQSCDYQGYRSVEQLRRRARFERISPAGLAERYPHDVTVTKE